MNLEINYSNCLELFKFCESRIVGFRDNEYKRAIATEILDFLKTTYPQRVTSFIELKDVYLSLEFSKDLFDNFLNKLVFFISEKNIDNGLIVCNYFMVWDPIQKKFKQQKVA